MKKKFKIAFFLMVALVDLADLVCDWLFYVDVQTSETGLVYGKPSQATIVSLLVLSVIGSLGVVLEITNLVIELRRGEPIVNVDLVGALVVWFEDLPHLAISISIASCREEAVSYFQIGKAVVIVISIIIRSIFYIVKCCKNDNSYNDGVLRKISRRLAIFGLILALACAIVVFVFTKAQRNLDGEIAFHVPETVIEDRYNDQRYFRNVHIFVSHPDFVSSGADNTENWMRIASIDSVRNSSGKDSLFGFEYQKTDQDFRITIRSVDNLHTKCYTIGETSVSSGILCNAIMDPKLDTYQYICNFTFLPPDFFFRKKIFGDIKFNFKYKSKGNCKSISNEDTDMEKLTVRYFRSEHAQDDHLVLESTGMRFYQKKNLTDVREVWKTGFWHCEPSGNLSPQLDTSITVPCQNAP